MQHSKSLFVILLIAVAVLLSGCDDDRGFGAGYVDARATQTPVVNATESPTAGVVVDKFVIDDRAVIRMIDHPNKQYCIRGTRTSSSNWTCSPLQE